MKTYHYRYTINRIFSFILLTGVVIIIGELDIETSTTRQTTAVLAPAKVKKKINVASVLSSRAASLSSAAVPMSLSRLTRSPAERE